MLITAIASNRMTGSAASALPNLHCAIATAEATSNLESPTLKESRAFLAAEAARTEICRRVSGTAKTRATPFLLFVPLILEGIRAMQCDTEQEEWRRWCCRNYAYFPCLQ
jgi:hypothetical protein